MLFYGKSLLIVEIQRESVFEIVGENTAAVSERYVNPECPCRCCFDGDCIQQRDQNARTFVHQVTTPEGVAAQVVSKPHDNSLHQPGPFLERTN